MAERILARVERQGECWVWTGWGSHGYGRIGLPGGGYEYAHRAAYIEFVGPIPEGLQIDHLCRNRACVNPAHLEPVTRAENTRRGLRGRLVTHCPQGHEYTDENTMLHHGRRACRQCNRDRVRRWRSRSRRV